MAIRIGASGLTELLPAAWTYSPATGQLAVRRFKGAHADAEAYAESLIGTGIEVALEPLEGTPLSIVTIRDVSGSGGGDVDANVETVWTLQPQIEQVSVFLHPLVQAEVKKLNATEATQWNKDTNEVRSGTEDGSWWTRYEKKSARWRSLYLCATGQQDYDVTRATLRKSRVVSPNSDIESDWVGVNSIYSTSRLVSLENIPTRIVGKLEAGDWLKTAGTAEQMSDGRYSISTEWLYRETGGWDTSLLYRRG